jgi:methylaspartate mutase sigma subunit
MTPKPHCLIATVESDSHMWNLVYLQLWLTEQGYGVKNLGSCTPVAEVLKALEQQQPSLLVVSSVNGHGYYQGKQLIEQVRWRYPDLECVIGGMLTTSQEQTGRIREDLLRAGYNGVFVGVDAMLRFESYLGTLRPQYAMCASQGVVWLHGMAS